MSPRLAGTAPRGHSVPGKPLLLLPRLSLLPETVLLPNIVRSARLPLAISFFQTPTNHPVLQFWRRRWRGIPNNARPPPYYCTCTPPHSFWPTPSGGSLSTRAGVPRACPVPFGMAQRRAAGAPLSSLTRLGQVAGGGGSPVLSACISGHTTPLQLAGSAWATARHFAAGRRPSRDWHEK